MRKQVTVGSSSFNLGRHLTKSQEGGLVLEGESERGRRLGGEERNLGLERKSGPS